jgi:hypothetical protein
MEVSVFEDRCALGDWRIEAIDEDGGIDLVIFSGRNAESRARDYATWKYPDWISAAA